MRSICNVKPLIIIAGATATGKTDAAIEAAKTVGGEIISADSMQIYKYMNIGTAKPTVEEMQGIPHYLIDELYPDDEFNVAVFKKMANEHIKTIREKGKLPIIVGGTGFYINAVIKDADFAENASNANIRSYYEGLADTHGKMHVYNILIKKDPESAEALHPNNVKRVIRALEFYDATGESIAQHNKSEKAKMVNRDSIVFVLDMERSRLYEKINRRVDKMIDLGLVNEVEGLLKMGYSQSLTSMQGIGYKEIVRYLRGDYSIEEAVTIVKQATRNYAKRQITWFKNQCNGIALDAALGAETLAKLIQRELESIENERGKNIN